jgi:hypothetical protein
MKQSCCIWRGNQWSNLLRRRKVHLRSKIILRRSDLIRERPLSLISCLHTPSRPPACACFMRNECASCEKISSLRDTCRSGANITLWTTLLPRSLVAAASGLPEYSPKNVTSVMDCVMQPLVNAHSCRAEEGVSL